MHTITLSWKSFNLDLEALDKKLRMDYPSYVGNQASNKLELFFTEDPAAIPMVAVMQDQEQTSQQPVLDGEGNPTLDENGDVVMETITSIVQVEVQQPSGAPSVKEEVEAMYEALSEVSPEVVSYRTAEQVQSALLTAKEALLTKDMALWTALDRKIFMGMNVTKDELIAAEVL